MKISIRNLILKIGYILLIFLNMRPMIFSIWPKMDRINLFIDYFQIIVTLSIFLLFLVDRRLKNLAFWGPIIGVFGCVIFSNLINGAIGGTFILQSLSLISFLLVVQNAFRNEHEHIMFASMTFYFIVITLLNLYSQIHYGIEGVYHDWKNSWQAYYVCGNANSFVFFYLTGVGISMAYSWKGRKEKLISYIYHLIVMCSLVYSYTLVNSSTGMVILGGLLVFRVLAIDRLKKIIVKYYKKIIVIVAVFAIWLILFGGWDSNWLLNMLNFTLGENESFIERGIIWQNAAENILKSPIWGHGSGAVRISSDMEGSLRSAHNNYLQLMIQGGITTFAFYVVLIWNCVKRNNKEFIKEEYDINIVIAFFLIAYLFEQNPFYVGFYLILIISYLKKHNCNK